MIIISKVGIKFISNDRYYESISDDTLSPVKNCAIPEVQKMVSIAQAIIMFLTYGTSK